jgi:hypothetical protein
MVFTRFWAKPLGSQKVFHDIVDGAPAARFVRRFTDLIERGYGLVERDVPPEQNS